MNILILNWRDIKHPRAGGAEVRLHEVYTPLVKQGHNIILYCCSFNNAPKYECINGIEVYRLGNDYTFSFLCMVNLNKWVKKHQADIVIEDLNKIPFYSPLFYNGPLIIQMHHLWKKSIFKEAFFLVACLIWLTEKTIPWIYKNCNFSVVSPSTKNELSSLGISEKKIKIIYNGANLDLYKPKELVKEHIILWIGRIQKYKGPIEACKILQLLNQDLPNLKLVIVGDGPYKNKVKEFAKKNNLSVFFTGFLDKKEKIKWLQKASIHLQSSYKEGWGLSVIEANACGCPVVANNTSGLRDSCQDKKTGLLYKYNDLEDAASKIKFILNDSKLTNQLVDNGLEWASSFSWLKNSDQMFKFINQSMDKHIK